MTESINSNIKYFSRPIKADADKIKIYLNGGIKLYVDETSGRYSFDLDFIYD